MNISNIIFDLDGTLVDSAQGILSSLAATLDEHGVKSKIELDAGIIGPPLPEMLERLSGCSEPERLALLAESFKRHYDGRGVHSTTPFPGIDSLLRQLHRRGMTLHIATNKRFSVASRIVELLGWKDLFRSLYALDMQEPRIPDKSTLIARQMDELGMSRGVTCYIGDRVEDGEAADSQPITFFLALWGYGRDGCGMDDLPSHWKRVASPAALVGVFG